MTKGGHRVHGVLQENGESRDETFPKSCSSCIVPTQSSCITSKLSSVSPTILTSSCHEVNEIKMPVSSGFVEGKPVTVLRDTGCSGIVVRRDCLHENCLT